MNFESSPEFAKDVKRLTKKWRSIPGDIEAAKPYIVPLYEQLASDVDIAEYRRRFFAGKRAAIMQTVGTVEVIKMRLDVQSLGASDKARLIFVAVRDKQSITFIELYAKNEKAREDTTRIKKHLKGII